MQLAQPSHTVHAERQTNNNFHEVVHRPTSKIDETHHCDAVSPNNGSLERIMDAIYGRRQRHFLITNSPGRAEASDIVHQAVPTLWEVRIFIISAIETDNRASRTKACQSLHEAQAPHG